jgi:hypothetical protein
VSKDTGVMLIDTQIDIVMNQKKVSWKFVVSGLFVAFALTTQMLPHANAAGSVAMQAESLMKLAPQAYNMGMRNGNPEKWNQYFESKSRRTAPGLVISGADQIHAYYKWEFETFKAKWNTKRVTVKDLVGAMEYEWIATHKPTGEKFTINGVAIFELGMSGKVLNMDFYYDSAPVSKYFEGAPGSGN